MIIGSKYQKYFEFPILVVIKRLVLRLRWTFFHFLGGPFSTSVGRFPLQWTRCKYTKFIFLYLFPTAVLFLFCHLWPPSSFIIVDNRTWDNANRHLWKTLSVCYVVIFTLIEIVITGCGCEMAQLYWRHTQKAIEATNPLSSGDNWDNWDN